MATKTSRTLPIYPIQVSLKVATLCGIAKVCFNISFRFLRWFLTVVLFYKVLPPLEDEKEKRRKKIEELRIKNDLPSENVQTNIGLVGQTLETVEHFTFNLWGSLWNININPDSPPPIQDSLQPVYSITVVKVNWYYRGLFSCFTSPFTFMFIKRFV